MNEISASLEVKANSMLPVAADFPICQQQVNGKPLVYLDNAATTQKPNSVLAAMNSYYQQDNANIHRGVHTLSVRATNAYEAARKKVQKFINAQHSHEIIFTSGTTESINLVASCFGRAYLQRGDEVLITYLEHHSNIVPWQLICEQVGAKIKVVPVDDAGTLDLNALEQLLSDNTKLLAITHLSNAIGTVNPIKEITALAHSHNVPVLVDGAQAISHMAVDVQSLNCDFYAFSAHKLYGPTGVGILYGKTKWLEQLPPYKGGGDMITEVTFEKTHFNKLPYKFEAGTPNIAGVIGLGASIDYLTSIGMDNVAVYEHELMDYATDALQTVEGLRIIGQAPNKAAVISFILDDIHPHDIGTVLDHEGIAIRAGHHCAMPLMMRYDLSATARVSFGIYNTKEDIAALCEAIMKLKRLFS